MQATPECTSLVEQMEFKVRQKFDSYPKDACIKLMRIREAIFEVARKDKIGQVSETLKWGEPSYLVKGGATVRIDWKKKHPEQICVYFLCQTTLVDTFKEIHKNLFRFEGNRAIVLPLSEEIPMEELKHCISMSLRYHSIKHLPLLGA